MDIISDNPNPLGRGAHFMLSSAAETAGFKMYFNWSAGTFDALPSYRWGEFSEPFYRRALSATYLLPLPSPTNEYTHFEYDNFITLRGNGLKRIPDEENRTDNVINGPLIGAYRLGATIMGPSTPRGTGSICVKNVSMRGPGLNPGIAPSIEKYYDFTNGTWSTAYKYTSLKVNSSRSAPTPRSFIATTPKMISNMAFNGMDRDTQYQLNIMDSSGGEYTLYDVALNDSALIANTGDDIWQRDAGIFTSEPYADTHITDYSDGTVIKSLNNGILADSARPTSWGSTFKQWEANAFTPIGVSIDKSIGPAAVTPSLGVSGFNNATHRPQIVTNFTLQDYSIAPSQQMALGWDVNVTEGKASTSMTGKMRVYAMHNGNLYNYGFIDNNWSRVRGTQEINTEGSTWVSSLQFAASSNQFASWAYGDVSASNDVLDYTHFKSPTIKAPTFGPTTKIIATLEFPTISESATVSVKSFKTYSFKDQPRGTYRVSGESFAFPEFPQPHDHTLQPATEANSPGELGQFLNRMQYFDYSAVSYSDGVSSIQEINNPMAPSPSGEKTFEEAVTMGAYLPSAGIFLGSGTLGRATSNRAGGAGLQFSGQGFVSGTLNQMGVINSDGYIYRHPYAVSSTHDASAGFLASSFTLPASTTYKHKTIRYILKLTKDEWKFLDYYMGGLGAVGLHTIDYKKTFEKLNTAYQISGTGATYTQGSRVGLYKVDNPNKNPVFNLSNKKVMFPPGLQIDWDTTDHITIIWDTTFT
jgi:hypothetical protein